MKIGEPVTFNCQQDPWVRLAELAERLGVPQRLANAPAGIIVTTPIGSWEIVDIIHAVLDRLDAVVPKHKVSSDD